MKPGISSLLFVPLNTMNTTFPLVVRPSTAAPGRKSAESLQTEWPQAPLYMHLILFVSFPLSFLPPFQALPFPHLTLQCCTCWQLQLPSYVIWAAH